MTAWIVVGCIVAALLLLGVVSFRLYVAFGSDQQTRVVFRVLCFSFQFAPKRPSKKKKKSKTRKKDCAGETANTQGEKPKEKKSRDMFETIDLAKRFLTPLPQLLHSIRRGVFIKQLQVCWCIAKSDAAETAIHYGYACEAFYSLLGVAQSLFHIKIKQIRIYPNFFEEKAFYHVNFCIQMRAWRIVSCGLRYLITVLINLIKVQFSKPQAAAEKNKGEM